MNTREPTTLCAPSVFPPLCCFSLEGLQIYVKHTHILDLYVQKYI